VQFPARSRCTELAHAISIAVAWGDLNIHIFLQILIVVWEWGEVGERNM
jgi:hypothetical protein